MNYEVTNSAGSTFDDLDIGDVFVTAGDWRHVRIKTCVSSYTDNAVDLLTGTRCKVYGETKVLKFVGKIQFNREDFR